MTYGRFVFAFALLMLLAGVGISRWVFGPLFAKPSEPSMLIAAAPTRTVTSHPVIRKSRGRHPVARPRLAPRSTSTPTPRPSATPLPTPSPTSGIVTLARYWVGTLQARSGQTIAIGYVIDNETGRTARTMLGASLKSAHSLSWASSALSDPGHDVVAVVPPGVSTHVRYFTLPPGLRPGVYDVAWGLRDSLTGRRDALVASSGALRVLG
jgi:hypothetical protein